MEIEFLKPNAPDVEYLQMFHWIVTDGLICDLTHPVEWAINAHRTPGGVLNIEYYEKLDKHLPRYLVERCEDFYCEHMESAEKVLKWCDEHYENGTNKMCLGYFEYLKPKIKEFIDNRRAKRCQNSTK